MKFKKSLIVALTIIALDQINKWYMIDIINIKEPIEVTSFFNLVMVWNRGISFGMFQHAFYSPIIFTFLAILIIIALLFWLKNTDSMIEIISIGLVIGGAIGNVIDRIKYGAVADFYDFHAAGYHWPAFNIADMAVFIGAVMLCICSLFCKKES